MKPTTATEPQTYLPEAPESQQVAEVLSFLETHEKRVGHKPTGMYFLSGALEGDQIELPPAIHQILKQALTALSEGKAVTIAPQNLTLTTQQAADILGISRPTVVKLIDSGQLPAQIPGARRRLLQLNDVITYQKKRRQEQYDAIFATSHHEFLDPADPEQVAHDLKEIRKERLKARSGSK